MKIKPYHLAIPQKSIFKNSSLPTHSNKIQLMTRENSTSKLNSNHGAKCDVVNSRYSPWGPPERKQTSQYVTREKWERKQKKKHRFLGKKLLSVQYLTARGAFWNIQDIWNSFDTLRGSWLPLRPNLHRKLMIKNLASCSVRGPRGMTRWFIKNKRSATALGQCVRLGGFLHIEENILMVSLHMFLQVRNLKLINSERKNVYL